MTDANDTRRGGNSPECERHVMAANGLDIVYCSKHSNLPPPGSSPEFLRAWILASNACRIRMEEVSA